MTHLTSLGCGRAWEVANNLTTSLSLLRLSHEISSRNHLMLTCLVILWRPLTISIIVLQNNHIHTHKDETRPKHEIKSHYLSPLFTTEIFFIIYYTIYNVCRQALIIPICLYPIFLKPMVTPTKIHIIKGRHIKWLALFCWCSFIYSS